MKILSSLFLLGSILFGSNPAFSQFGPQNSGCVVKVNGKLKKCSTTNGLNSIFYQNNGSSNSGSFGPQNSGKVIKN